MVCLYHRSSQAGHFNCRACVEPIRFNADGNDDEVEMTTAVASTGLPANAARRGVWRLPAQRLRSTAAIGIHGSVTSGARYI